jgi:hypothetical protein
MWIKEVRDAGSNHHAGYLLAMSRVRNRMERNSTPAAAPTTMVSITVSAQVAVLGAKRQIINKDEFGTDHAAAC